MNNADDIPQSERRRVMANDRKVREAATYHSVAQSAVDDERGAATPLKAANKRLSVARQ